MKWNWKLGEFAGIGVYIHATFLFLIAWIGLTEWIATRSLGGMLIGILFTLLIFVSVVLHEFGHALAARRYGIRTNDITLYPIGGVARLERMPEEPRQELWIALAGPAVNLMIAAFLYIGLGLANALLPLGALSLAGSSLAERLAVTNLTLLAFNLLPAFPLDGGRVLRALLALRMDYLRATQLAARIGQGLAIVLGLAGFFVNPFLVMIAFFIWIAAAQEAAMVRQRYSWGGMPYTPPQPPAGGWTNTPNQGMRLFRLRPYVFVWYNTPHRRGPWLVEEPQSNAGYDPFQATDVEQHKPHPGRRGWFD
jgi:Zn-dependent protease